MDEKGKNLATKEDIEEITERPRKSSKSSVKDLSFFQMM